MVEVADIAHAVPQWPSARMQPIDAEWRTTVKHIMDIFVRNTNKATVEVCEQSLRWHYAEADPEFGLMQSTQLEETLQEFTPCDVVCISRDTNRTQKYIEARSKDVSKAIFLSGLLQTLWSADVDIDFVLTVGDDESDESLFEAANQLPLPRVCYNESAIFTAVVGRRQSSANVCVESVSELMRIFRRLGRMLSREKRNYSTSDLHGLTISKRRAKLLDLESNSFTRFMEKQQQMASGIRAGIAQAVSMPTKKNSISDLVKGRGSHRPVFVTGGEEGGPKDDDPQRRGAEVNQYAAQPRPRSIEEYMNRMDDSEEEPLSF